jgi:hypothetical protein
MKISTKNNATIPVYCRWLSVDKVDVRAIARIPYYHVPPIDILKKKPTPQHTSIQICKIKQTRKHHLQAHLTMLVVAVVNFRHPLQQ